MFTVKTRIFGKSNQNQKSNLFLYNIQHNIYVYIITLLQFKIYKYNDCKCVVWTSHSHMAVFLAAIIFGGFSNMAIWQRFNLAISHTGNI